MGTSSHKSAGNKMEGPCQAAIADALQQGARAAPVLCQLYATERLNFLYWPYADPVQHSKSPNGAIANLFGQ